MTPEERTPHTRRVRWLVTGAAGKLGQDLLAVLGTDPTAEVTGLRRTELDITDAAAVREAVAGHDIVVNAAAWTDVDGAEASEAAATAVNGTGVRHLADACGRVGARLLQVSTDYVFSGEARTPYGEDAATAPVNAYGRGKLAGERAVVGLLPDAGYVVRTSWLYGEHGRDFVTTVLELAETRDTLDVVDDQHGQPTWSYAVAERLALLGGAALAGTAPPGIYHATAGGRTTWMGLARTVFELAGLDPRRVRPTTSAAYARPAPRPAFSVLGHERWAAAGLPPMPHWRTSLEEALRRPAFRALTTPGQ
ncbi:dTDP-4-dehydrorhamnose reductase [Streptomyces abikoensis]|uniref:dTDP-4-dehydrorhamnose reductase n=1 Tax=Streptomyces abikoensis TaxID=97398 RepID=UPI001675CD7A|nr:dTDP-4-dehydrorhamnose reductase [Streptomyces abikoensis]GGP51338.1 NAD(P)-dependent oxidoreductase [Streptomyces abikoensis]